MKELDLQNIDFTFLDGGHSYQTVINDLTILYEIMKDKKKVILCDDYGKESYIPEVEKAINDFAKKNNLKLNLIENRFVEIITWVNYSQSNLGKVSKTCKTFSDHWLQILL